MLAVFLPLLRTGRLGYPLNWRSCLIMVGAVHARVKQGVHCWVWHSRRIMVTAMHAQLGALTASRLQAWGGLRGAVGLAMSLFILLDPLIVNGQYKALCVFFMGWMALLTVGGGFCWAWGRMDDAGASSAWVLSERAVCGLCGLPG
jgi:hypothetical protein